MRAEHDADEDQRNVMPDAQAEGDAEQHQGRGSTGRMNAGRGIEHQRREERRQAADVRRGRLRPKSGAGSQSQRCQQSGRGNEKRKRPGSGPASPIEHLPNRQTHQHQRCRGGDDRQERYAGKGRADWHLGKQPAKQSEQGITGWMRDAECDGRDLEFAAVGWLHVAVERQRIQGDEGDE